MASINELELIDLYTEIKQVYSRCQELTAENISTFMHLYNGYTYEELRDAFHQYSLTERYSPQPSDLIAIVRTTRENASRLHGADKIYNPKSVICKYCQDTGYMHVNLPGLDFYAECVHKRPQSSEHLNRFGKFKFKYPRWNVNVNLVFNDSEHRFEAEEGYVPTYSYTPVRKPVSKPTYAPIRPAEQAGNIFVDLLGGF